MASVPCPPYYTPPTYTYTPYYATGSFIRHYNDWYRCLVGPYCNAPSFLGYSPPGEGEKWTDAWSFVELSLRFDCNPELESDESPGAAGGLILTKKPTNAPTTLAESPSVISGVVWYDANGDGRRNDPNAALTKEDFDVSEKELGAGIGNLKVLLRRCGEDFNDELVGVAYTFPFGMGVELGKASVFGVDYLQEIQDYASKGNGGDGGDISAGRIGYYSFRILPNQIPGDFYVVFQAPVGYRLTGGSGTYWEVQDEALKDRVFPMVDANTGMRFLQVNDVDGAIDMLSNSTGIGGNETMILNETADNATIYPSDFPTIPTNKPSPYQGEIPDINDFVDAIDTSKTDSTALGPIIHSGYYSRSRCISIKTNPMGINQIDAGMTASSWPIIPFQYASFILTLQFYDQSTNTKRRELQEVISLECRNYQKLKSEGIIVEDIWGCETPINVAPTYDFVELSMDQGGEMVKIVKDFLSMSSGDFVLKNIGLTYQQIELLEKKKKVRLLLPDEGRLDADRIFENAAQLRRREVDGSNRKLRNAAAAEVARLELGFRIVGESATSSQDLTTILLQAIEDDSKTLLSSLKSSSSLPDYMTVAGSINARKVLEVPQENKVIDVNVSPIKSVSDSAGMSSGEIAGIVIGVLVFVGLLLGMFVNHCKMRNDDSDSSSSDSSSSSSSDSSKVHSKRRSKYVERQFANAKEEEHSYESDSLSSRWYSDYEGSDVDKDTDEFDLKEAFYSGRIKPVSPARRERRSRKSTPSSSSRGSSRVGGGVSRVRSAVSQSTRSSASWGKSLGSSRVSSSASRVRSASQSARSSYTSRGQSSGSKDSRSTASRSTSSKLRYNSIRKSRPSSRSSLQSSRISTSSRDTGARSSQSSRQSMVSNSIGTTERSAGISQNKGP